MTEENRAACGFEGRTWALSNGLTAEQMGNKMIEMMDYLFSVNKQPRPSYTLENYSVLRHILKSFHQSNCQTYYYFYFSQIQIMII